MVEADAPLELEFMRRGRCESRTRKQAGPWESTRAPTASHRRHDLVGILTQADIEALTARLTYTGVRLKLEGRRPLGQPDGGILAEGGEKQGFGKDRVSQFAQVNGFVGSMRTRIGVSGSCQQDGAAGMVPAQFGHERD